MIKRLRSGLLRLVPWLPSSVAGVLIPPENVWTRDDDHEIAVLDVDRPTRILFGGLNTAGQAKRWSDAIGSVSGVYSTSLGIRRSGSFQFIADAMPSKAATWHSPTWSHRQSEQVLKHATHVLMESGEPILGVEYGRNARREVLGMKAAGVCVASVLHGSDVRIPSKHIALNPYSPFRDPLDGLTSILERKSNQTNEFLDEISLPEFVSTPDLLAYRPNATWLPVLHDASLWQYYGEEPEICALNPEQKPIVGHIPSRNELKGTKSVRTALEQLDAKGTIEYRELHGLSPEGVARTVSKLDVLVDQLGIGAYGTASVEAMSIGVPVVAELGESTRSAIRSLTGLEVPIIEATPDTIAEVVGTLIGDSEECQKLSDLGRQYVQMVHSPEATVRALARGLSLDFRKD